MRVTPEGSKEPEHPAPAGAPGPAAPSGAMTGARTTGGMGQWAPARVRGLQKPYSRDQLAAMCLYPVLTGVSEGGREAGREQHSAAAVGRRDRCPVL